MPDCLFKPKNPEEFLVEEIAPNGKVLEIGGSFSEADFQELKQVRGAEGRGKFAWFVLQKTNWNTSQALAELAGRMRIARTRFDFAGNKDRIAVTTQLCSCFAGDRQKIMDVGNQIKDLKVLGTFQAWDKVKMGFLAGNRFTVQLTKENCGLEPAEVLARIEKNFAAGKGRVPNFFGSQRFGSVRKNTADVGELLLKGDWQAAAMNYLTFSDENERDAESREARKRLAEEKDFKAALDYFPRHLKYERTMLGWLANNPTDFAGALRKLPRSLALLFVHAFQAKLFNEVLQKKIEEGGLAETGEGETANIVGYESELSEEENVLLEKHGLSKEVFLIKGMPELSSKGTARPMAVLLKDFEILEKEPVKIRFSLPSGSYATVAVDWILLH